MMPLAYTDNVATHALVLGALHISAKQEVRSQQMLIAMPVVYIAMWPPSADHTFTARRSRRRVGQQRVVVSRVGYTCDVARLASIVLVAAHYVLHMPKG